MIQVKQERGFSLFSSELSFKISIYYSLGILNSLSIFNELHYFCVAVELAEGMIINSFRHA